MFRQNLKELFPNKQKCFSLCSIESSTYFTKFTLQLNDPEANEKFIERKEEQVANNLVIFTIVEAVFYLFHLLLEFWSYQKPERFVILLSYALNVLAILLYAWKRVTINYTPVALFLVRFTLAFYMF